MQLHYRSGECNLSVCDHIATVVSGFFNWIDTVGIYLDDVIDTYTRQSILDSVVGPLILFCVLSVGPYRMEDLKTWMAFIPVFLGYYGI